MPENENDARPVVIDYRREVRPPLLNYTGRQSHGELTVCGATFMANPGAVISTAQFVIAINKSAPYKLSWREGQKKKTQIVRPGTIHIMPVGISTYLEWGDAQPEVTIVAIDQTMVLRIVDSAGMNPASTLPIVLAIRDPMIRQLAEACEREISNLGSNGHARMFAESLVTTLVTHIFRTYTSAGQWVPIKGGLTPKQTNRVLTYVQEHLSENVGVDDLAEEVGLSTHHFAETFKKSVGVTPYRYLVNQRIERSKDLLKQGKMPVKQIAEVVGFSSHTQFSAQFRKIVGVSPAQFRREAH